MIDLDEAKRLTAARATPGPWESDDEHIVVRQEPVWRELSGGGRGLEWPAPITVIGAEPCGYMNSSIYGASADLEFICRARTLVPELIAEVERLRAENARLQHRGNDVT